MAQHALTDGYHYVPIVDLGRQFQNLGLTVVEHPEFGGVSPGIHSSTSYHYTPNGSAIDVQDWRDDNLGGVHWLQRTKNLRDLMRGSGVEVIGPGDMAGHESHLHLAAKDGMFRLTPAQYSAVFGGDKMSTFAGVTDDGAPKALPSVVPTPERQAAREKIMAYKEAPPNFIPGAFKKYPGIIAKYEGTGASSAPATMKSPKPTFDIRSRDSDARGGYDPRFDVHPRKR